MKNGCNLVKKWDTKIFSIIDPWFGCSHHFEVLHCNYNGEIGQKLNSVVTFDWRVPLTSGQRDWTAFCNIFLGTPQLNIFGAPNIAKYAKYEYLGAPNMVTPISLKRSRSKIKRLNLTDLQTCSRVSNKGRHTSPLSVRGPKSRKNQPEWKKVLVYKHNV